MNSEEPTMTIGLPKYKIEYYNRAFKLENSVEANSLDAAIKTASSISAISEIENVKIYEIKEILISTKSLLAFELN